jgi:hypothetical protein
MTVRGRRAQAVAVIVSEADVRTVGSGRTAAVWNSLCHDSRSWPLKKNTRYIIWRNNHAYDERLRRIVDRANVACYGTGVRRPVHRGLAQAIQSSLRLIAK